MGILCSCIAIGVTPFANCYVLIQLTGLFVISLPCRTILSALHFNHNLNREKKKNVNGETRLRVTYPKYKEGEASVKEVSVQGNFGKQLASEATYILDS